MKQNKIILFDGVCNLCSGSVQYIIKHDLQKVFKFSSLQSSFGQQTLKNNNFNTSDFSSFIYLDGSRVYTKSSASLKVFKQLSGPIKLLYIFIIIPKPLRDWVYSIIAKNRYAWFGKSDTCWVPTPELKSRFI